MFLGQRFTVQRIDPVPDRSLVGQDLDYADSFALDLTVADDNTPEHWARTALGQAPTLIRVVIRVAQAHVLRLHLRPAADPKAVLGWCVARSTYDTLHLRATGPLVHADIVVHRPSLLRVTTTTSLVYKQKSGRWLWMLVGPLHRRIAPYLVGRAATSLVRPEVPGIG